MPSGHRIATVKRPPHGKKAGAFGDIACFSFFSNKNLATGEGGMYHYDRDDLAQRVRSLRSHGMTTLTWDRQRGTRHRMMCLRMATTIGSTKYMRPWGGCSLGNSTAITGSVMC